MAKPPNILLYSNMDEVLDDLTDAQSGQVFRAIFKYAQGITPEFNDPLVKLAFKPFKVIIDRNLEKYKDKCNTNQENGRKGGRPRKQQVPEEPDGLPETGETDRFFNNQENRPVFDKPKNPNITNGNKTENKKNPPFNPPNSPIDERSLEFEELRLWWNDVVRGEGETAGWLEYKQLKAARDRNGNSAWPGINRIRDDIEQRIAAPCWGSPNFYPGLGKYLRERMWTAPIKAIEEPMSWDERESKKNREAFLKMIQQEEQA